MFTWSVDKVHSMSEPVKRNGSRVDSDPSLSLLSHVVHHGIAIVNIWVGNYKNLYMQLYSYLAYNYIKI